MSLPASPATDTIHTSRLWALLTLHVTAFIFPVRMLADSHGVSTVKVSHWFAPWMREDEHLPMSHIAEIRHERGLVWDSITVESSGGLNPLSIDGLPKGQASAFIAHVRGRMGPALAPAGETAKRA